MHSFLYYLERGWKLTRIQLIFLIIVVFFVAGCGADSFVLQGEDVFHDEFNPGQTGHWLIEGDDIGRAAVIGEQLLIEIDAPQILHYSTLDEPTFSDFILQVEVTQIAGDLESSSGIIFRMQSPEQFYRFDITSNGLFIVERRNAGGSWTRFIEDWTESTAIIQGLNNTNRLKVKAIGSNLTFYINDSMVLQASDSSYPTGKIALNAGTFGMTGLQVAFDNVVVMNP